MTEVERPTRNLVRASKQDRRPLKTRGEVIAFRCSLRVASIPELSGRLNGALLDQIKGIVASEVDMALGFRMGGPPPEDGRK